MWSIKKVRAWFSAGNGNSERRSLRAVAGSSDIGDACLDWRQGDVFQGAKTYVFESTSRPTEIAAPHGAVVVSQTCDACRPERERIQIAPVVQLQDANDIREALTGKRPQYVAIPPLGTDYFANLDVITTINKTVLVACERVCSLATDEDVREFAFAVARRFGRFAYPDEVVKCLDPLADALKSKARKPNSPLGKALTNLHSIRVQCDDWTTAPRELTLIIILEPGVVPLELEDIDDAPSNLPVPGADLKAEINSCATYLAEVGRGAAEKYFAWQQLADTWARQCEEAAESLLLTGHVASVVAELVSIDEFPLSRVLRTESLDLDYLSDSRKPLT